MRAVAMFPKEKVIKVVDRPAPTIERDRQVRLRMLEVGVCGTDHEIARFEYGVPPAGEPYLVMGHESLAEVVEVRNGSKLKPGDLVVTTVRRPCGKPECRPCHHDRPDFCTTGDYTERGIKGRHGFMTDEVIDDDKNMHVVPRSLADIAVLTEPLTIAEKGLIELDSVLTRMPWVDPEKAESRGLNAVVLGAGPGGSAGRDGAARARLQDLGLLARARLERAGGLGREGGRPVHLLERASGRRSGETCRQRRSHLRGDGLGEPRLRGHARDRRQRRLHLHGRSGSQDRGDARRTRRSCATWSSRTRCSTARSTPVLPRSSASIADLAKFEARWPEQVRALITGHYPPEKITEVLAGEPGAIKDVIRFGTPSAAKAGTPATGGKNRG